MKVKSVILSLFLIPKDFPVCFLGNYWIELEENRWHTSLHLTDYITGTYRLFLISLNIFKYGMVNYFTSIKNLTKLLLLVKYDWFLRYNTLVDLWAFEKLQKPGYFILNYMLNSILFTVRLKISILVDEWTWVPTVSLSVFNASNWLEREVWDMHGIAFENHIDLRRILTDYGFLGHPLKKNFPLTGFFEVKYDETTKKVTLETINFIQELRFFSFAMPWRKLN